MSKNDVLYMKGMNMSECSEDDEADEDIWDDSKLNNAYDRALKMANVEVAKRLAMSTNSKTEKVDSKSCKKAHKNAKNNNKEQIKKDKFHWKPGMPCRALYEDDGLEYEAFVLRVINDKEVIVRFLGYENSEIVPIHTLKPTLGKKERAKQVEEAIKDKQDDGFETLQHGNNLMDCFSDGTSVASTEKSSSKKKTTKNKKNAKQSNGLNADFTMPGMPSMPFAMPNMDMFKNLSPSDLPLPPPPLRVPTDQVESEDQALSSMLLSWYMSGYYTGLYQGMKRSKGNWPN